MTGDRAFGTYGPEHAVNATPASAVPASAGPETESRFGPLSEIFYSWLPEERLSAASCLAHNLGMVLVTAPSVPIEEGREVESLREAFMEGRSSVRGINRNYSEQAWQASKSLRAALSRSGAKYQGWETET